MSSEKFIDKYYNDIISKVGLVYPEILTDISMQETLKKNLLEKKKEQNYQIVNNYTNAIVNVSSERLLNTYISKGHNISGFGVLFKNSDTKENIPGKVVKHLLFQRKIVKKEMLKFVDSTTPEVKAMHNKLDIEQNTLKILANSYYGAFAEKGFHFYNPFLGPSVTYTGVHIILSAIYGFEGLLADNVDFFSFDEILLFLNNIKQNEVYDENISLGFEISSEELFDRFISKSHFKITDLEKENLLTIFENAEVWLKEKWFFKNNLFKLLENSDIKDFIAGMIDTDFLNPEKPPERITEDLLVFNDMMQYYIGYPYQIPNKETKIHTLKRKTVLITDTDSTFIYLDPFVKTIQSHLDTKFSRIEQVALVNVITYIITNYISKVFYIFATNQNVLEDDKKLINMKNEFMFSRVMLTRNKKSYAARLLMQEGIMFTKPKFELKGIQIKKTTTAKTARKIFADILEKEILDKEEINPIVPFKQFLQLEKQVEESVNNCETTFLKPAKFSTYDSYVSPLSQPVCRGTLLWNTLYPENTILNISNVWILNFKDIPNEDLHKYLPEEILAKIENVYFKHTFKENKSAKKISNIEEEDTNTTEKETVPKTIKDYGIQCIAIPKGVSHYPEYFKSMSDVTTIVNNTIKNGNILLESIGFKIFSSFNHETSSNVITF